MASHIVIIDYTMGRKPKSTNKYISAKLRKEYDSFLLVDKDFDEEPSQSLLRIYKKSKRITHTIFYVDFIPGQGESQNIDDYIIADKEIRVKNTNLYIEHSGKRNNDSMYSEIQSFYDVTIDYIINKLFTNDLFETRMNIDQYLSKLEKTVRTAINETYYWKDPKQSTFEFEHVFFLHSSSRKFIQLQHPDNFQIYLKSNPEYFKQVSAILRSWYKFWKLHIPFIKGLRKLFLAKGTFRLKDEITYQNKALTTWLETGINQFFDPIDKRIEDDLVKIKYLKYIILNGKYEKPKKKKG